MGDIGDRLIKKQASGLPRLGRKAYPEARRRVQVSVRLLPATKEALERIGADNIGRAIDDLVTAATSDAGAEVFSHVRQMIVPDSIPVTRL